jgi:TRAP-type C4-dicarboxylate transport system permease small subunit
MTDGRRKKTKRKDQKNGTQSTWQRISDVMSTVNKVQALISSFAVFVIMTLISADVVGRFVFNRPVMGTYELGQMFMVGMVFLGLSYTQMVGGNVTVDTFTRRLNPRMRAALSIFADIVGLVIFGLMTYSSGNLAWIALKNKRTVQGLLGMPLYPSKFVVAIGTATLTLYFLIKLVGEINLVVPKKKGINTQ